MSGDWFLAHNNTKNGDEDWENKFIVNRGYFTLKKEIKLKDFLLTISN